MPSLYLCAADSHWVPAATDELLRRLDALGLLALSPAGGRPATDRFPPGAEFPTLVMFLGCSPRVPMAPAEALGGQEPCCVRQHLYSTPRCIGNAAAVKPRCPACRTAHAPFEPVAAHTRHRCPACGKSAAVSELDWRQAAGFGRYFLEIGGIHPHEAVPSDKLLATLGEHSATPWRYFYSG